MPGILLRVHVWRETLLELFHCWLIFYHSRVKWNQKNKTNKNNLYFPNWLFRTDIYGECNYFSGQNVINTPWGQNILWRLNPEIRIFWQHDFFCLHFMLNAFISYTHKEQDSRFLLFSMEREYHSNVHWVAQESQNVLMWKTGLF